MREREREREREPPCSLNYPPTHTHTHISVFKFALTLAPVAAEVDDAFGLLEQENSTLEQQSSHQQWCKFAVRTALTAGCTTAAILLGKVDIITGIMGDTASCLLSTVFPLLIAILLAEYGKRAWLDSTIIAVVSGMSLASLGALVSVAIRR